MNPIGAVGGGNASSSLKEIPDEPDQPHCSATQPPPRMRRRISSSSSGTRAHPSARPCRRHAFTDPQPLTEKLSTLLEDTALKARKPNGGRASLSSSKRLMTLVSSGTCLATRQAHVAHVCGCRRSRRPKSQPALRSYVPLASVASTAERCCPVDEIARATRRTETLVRFVVRPCPLRLQVQLLPP